MSAFSVVVLMGVSGVGKTTVGHALADHLGWTFVDADDLHSPLNVAKMERGEGLTDADRAPWLTALRALIERHLSAEAPLVLACSALRAEYRDRLRIDDRVRFVWLDASPAEVERRLNTREGHFAGARLLPSQLAALEPPDTREAQRVQATDGVEVTVERVVRALGLDRRA